MATFRDVVSAELQDLGFPEMGGPEHLENQLHKLQTERPLTALCLSGGGIRSATFGLGVLQALAKHKWLAEVDYLSTVSGGGYIGSWLSKWVADVRDEMLANGVGGCTPEQSAMEDVQEKLGGPIESDRVQRLRQFSNYLSPQLGFTTDFQLMCVTYLRNLFLLWCCLLPLLVAIVCMPVLVKASMRIVQTPSLGVLGGLLAVAAVAAVIYWLMPSAPEEHLQLWPVLVLALASMFLAIGRLDPIGWVVGFVLATEVPDASDLPRNMAILGPAMPLLFAGLLAAVVAYLVDSASWKHRSEWLTSLAGWLVTTALGWAVFSWVVLFIVPEWNEILKVAQDIASLRTDGTEELKKLILERDKGTGTEFAGTFWAAQKWELANRLATGSWFVGALSTPWTPASIGAAMAAVTSLAGYRSRRGKSVSPHEEPRVLDKLVRLLMNVGSGLVILLLVFSVADFLHGISPKLGDLSIPSSDRVFNLALVGGAGALVIHGLFACLLGVNKLSLNSFYGRRLVSCYHTAPGKSQADTPLTELPARPFHIINTALNLTDLTTEQLSWQERKAASMTLSRRHAGTWARLVDTGRSQFAEELGYSDVGEYGGGLTLQDAVAISGAAAAPNMGYHTSSLLSLIMTVFNVRLGAWKPNPGERGATVLTNAEPRYFLWSLLQEAFGAATANRNFVYLSDGGHFENLGLYEMVRRRCHRILVVDASQDEDCSFEDLENAIRKIRIDLGIDIDFPAGLPPFPSGNRHFAVGTIGYSGKDGQEVPDGTLIYLKPCMTGDEDLDVTAFSEAHRQTGDRFPHQPTTDQYFSESQFESYRRLGWHSVSDDLIAALAGGEIQVNPANTVSRPHLPSSPIGYTSSPMGFDSLSASRANHGPSFLGSIGSLGWGLAATAGVAGIVSVAAVSVIATDVGYPPPQPTVVTDIPVLVLSEGAMVDPPTDNRIMLPIFGEPGDDSLEHCKNQEGPKCKLLSGGLEEAKNLLVGRGGVSPLVFDDVLTFVGNTQVPYGQVDVPLALSPYSGDVFARMAGALHACSKINSGSPPSVVLRGFASSTNYDFTALSGERLINSGDLNDQNSAALVNLVLADLRAATVARRLSEDLRKIGDPVAMQINVKIDSWLARLAPDRAVCGQGSVVAVGHCINNARVEAASKEMSKARVFSDDNPGSEMTLRLKAGRLNRRVDLTIEGCRAVTAVEIASKSAR